MEINEEKLIALLEKHFPTKKEFGSVVDDVAVLKTDVSVLKTDVAVLKTDVSVLKTDVAVLKTDVSSLKTEFYALRTEMREGFEQMNERFDELKSSASTLDNILEKHPIERIDRLEKYNKLPTFKLHLATE